MDKFIFLGQVFCGAQYALSEIRHHRIYTQHGDVIKENAIGMIQILSNFFSQQHYQINMVAYDDEKSRYFKYPNQPLDKMGETFFNLSKPGYVLFIHNDEPASEMTFKIGVDHCRLVADRFGYETYDNLLSEVQQVIKLTQY